jgi:signal transduction histidine kinase/ligand-binding sensor domain-containing protein
MAESADGFMWLGTQSGLRRFDGFRFRDVDPVREPALGDAHCRRLLATRDGSLWVATGGGFVVRDESDTIFFQWKAGTPALVRRTGTTSRVFTTRDGLPSDWVWSLAEDPDGSVWIGTERGVAHYRDGAFSSYGEREGLPDPAVLALLADAHGDLWVGTRRGLVVRRGDRFVATDVRTPVTALAPGPSRGSVWVAMRRSVALHAAERTTIIETPNTPTALEADRDGRLWAGSNAGLVRIDPSAKGPQVTTATEVPGWVLSLARDRTGSLWAGMRTGALVQRRPARIVNVEPPDSSHGSIAFSVLAARDGSIWATTSNALFRWRAGEVTEYPCRSQVPVCSLRYLAEGHDGSLWIGSYHEGLARLRDGRFTRVQAPAALPSNEVRALFVDGAGNLWVGWLGGGVTRYAGGEVTGAATTFGAAQGLCGRDLGPIVEGRGGRVWIGGWDGLSRIEGGHGSCFTARNGLPASGVAALAEDATGTLWLAGFDDVGLVRFRNGRFTPLPRAIGLPTGTFFAILDDRAGHFWLTSPMGVFRVDRDDLDRAADGRLAHVPALAYSAEDGLRSQECTATFSPLAALDGGGRAWVATLAGISAMPVPEREPPEPAQAAIDDVRVDGVAHDPAAPLRLPAGGGDVEIRYTAPSLAHPERLRFRTLMEGLDDRWSGPGTAREMRYSHLGPGRYRFRVGAIDELGRSAGREAVLALTVPAHLYQTGGFAAGCVLLLGALGAAVHRARVVRIERRHRALHEERARIARDLHDSLGQGFSSIGLHIDGLRLTLGDAPESVKEVLERTRQVVEFCQAETRRSIWNLRAGQDGARTLGAVLDSVVALFPRGAGIGLELDDHGGPLPPLVDREIAQIAGEAITNAVRHAHARRITVTGRHDGRGLSLAVRDDGVGTDGGAVPGPEGGTGVLGMHERAARMGGTLEVHGGSGGTEVVLTVPADEIARLSTREGAA